MSHHAGCGYWEPNPGPLVLLTTEPFIFIKVDEWWMCIFVYLCVQSPWKPKDGVRSSWSRVTHDCKLPCPSARNSIWGPLEPLSHLSSPESSSLSLKNTSLYFFNLWYTEFISFGYTLEARQLIYPVDLVFLNNLLWFYIMAILICILTGSDSDFLFVPITACMLLLLFWQ